MPQPIRPAYSRWPEYDRRLREVVGPLTEEQLALRPAPERWPIWATIGHAACQLEHVLSAADLVDALESTFRIVEACLDRWTLDMLDEVLRRPEWDASWVHTRGAVLQRVFSHDVYHVAELNEVLAAAGLAQVDLWD